MTCEWSTVGGAFHLSCRNPRGVAAGYVERGLLRWCATVRKFDKYGQKLDEKRQCFRKQEDAVDFLRGSAQGYSASFGGRKKPSSAAQEDKYEVLRHIRKDVPHRPTRQHEDKRRKQRREWRKDEW
jgi:hypothetical protein